MYFKLQYSELLKNFKYEYTNVKKINEMDIDSLRILISEEINKIKELIV